MLRGLQAFAGIKDPLDGENRDAQRLMALGTQYGSARTMELANLAEANKPTLRQFDNFGNRIDVIDYHDSYHALMTSTIEAGATVHGHNVSTPTAHVVRAGLLYMANQMEPGHCCPVTMTSAAVPVLQQAAGQHPFIQQLLGKVLSGRYDPANLAVEQKRGATIGMSMTERQGGSDVRSNMTTATQNARRGDGSFLLSGHKWFTSAPMSDGFLTLAKVDEDTLPSCFLVPRWRPDGARNSGFIIMRLKDKLADRANASSEVEYDGNCYSLPVGERGKGIKTILQMVQLTRLDCCIGAAGSSRRALQVALGHTATREAFGSKLLQQPLMENLMAELCVEAEAHTLCALKLARAYGDAFAAHTEAGAADAEEEQEIFRVGVAIMKYYSTKAQPQFVYECLESLGGNGFTENWPLAKLFRHSPLNSIWEGSGNVVALDVLRAAKSLPFLLKDVRKSRGMDSAVDRYFDTLVKDIKALESASSDDSQRYARNLVDRLAILMQSSVMMTHGQDAAAQHFNACRIKNETGRNYGAVAVSSKKQAQTIINDFVPIFG